MIGTARSAKFSMWKIIEVGRISAGLSVTRSAAAASSPRKATPVMTLPPIMALQAPSSAADKAGYGPLAARGLRRAEGRLAQQYGLVGVEALIFRGRARRRDLGAGLVDQPGAGSVEPGHPGEIDGDARRALARRAQEPPPPFPARANPRSSTRRARRCGHSPRPFRPKSPARRLWNSTFGAFPLVRRLILNTLVARITQKRNAKNIPFQALACIGATL